MNRLVIVGQILDSYLTTETLNRLSPAIDNGLFFSKQKLKGDTRKLFVDLLEHAGEVVMADLKRDLSADEVILIFNRVKQFLIARGLD
jgi:hypothetical protein